MVNPSLENLKIQASINKTENDKENNVIDKLKAKNGFI